MDIKQIAIKGTTQDHLPLEDITQDLVILKDGSCCYVLETSSVNFDLLSQKEQEAMIYAYAAILNSLTFPIQIFIRSTVKDLSSYIRYLRSWEEKSRSRLIKKQIAHYRKFVTEVVEKNNVLAKSFYLVVPFSSLELGLESLQKSFSFPWQKKERGLPLPKEKIIEKAKASLEPRKAHLIRVFARLGLKVRQLKTQELIALFHQIYNEDLAGGESVALADIESLTVSYTSSPKKDKVGEEKKGEVKK